MNKSYAKAAQNVFSSSFMGNIFRSIGGIVTEFTILYGVMIALFLSIDELQFSFLAMNLHPLFIIACLLGIRHGFLAGLLAASLSSLVYFFSYVYLELDPILFFNSYEYYKFPLIFLFGGYLSGRFYDSSYRKITEMREANTEVLQEYDQLEKTYKQTIRLYNEMKEQIVGSEYSIFSLYDIASSLQTTNPEKVYTESIGLLYKFIKAQAITIYTIDRSGFMRTKIHFGSKRSHSGTRRLSEFPMYQEVLSSKRAVRWKKDAGNDAPVFSAPIVSEDKVIGIIDIDAIEFEYVTEYSFSVFQLISEWIAKALSQALAIDKQFNLMGVDYSNMLELPQFELQRQEEQVRKDKYGLPFCLAVYDLQYLDADHIVPLMQRSLRSVDYIAYDHTRNLVKILLPATDETNYSIVEERLFKKAGQRLSRQL
ncbi:MAG: hypothetical protein K9M84_06745 [Spirochaetia bacterium]|nr:hypothetical protein [Spirochaetia bacterium]